MIEYKEALERVLAQAKPLPSERVPLLRALGRVLAGNIRAREDIPPFDKATMDGYAVRAHDTAPPAGAEEASLDIVEDLPAGRVARRILGPGQAARIMTGAPLPKGADAVVMVEDTEKSGGRVIIRRAVRPGDNTGKAGEDVRKGEVVLEGGSTVGPAELGMLAALGQAQVRLVRRPKLAVISTGDEIVEPGEKRRPGRIRNSNGYSLLAMALQAGAEASYLGIARDRGLSIKAKISRGYKAEVLVLSGGVSVGDYDLVRDELGGLGVRPVFWKARIKPGKPVFFGVRGRQLVFGLPGNPAGAMVTFLLFVRPALDKMLGKKEIGPRAGRAVLGRDLILKPGRTQFLRGLLTQDGSQLVVDPFPDQRSGVLKSMVGSRVLIVIPAEISRLEKGREVDILFMD